MGLPSTLMQSANAAGALLGLEAGKRFPVPSLRPVATAELNLSAKSDEVVALFKAGRHTDAIDLFLATWTGQPKVVQDALDRLVGARVNACYAPPPGASPATLAALTRLSSITITVPKMPLTAQVLLLNQQQRHDVYGSIVEIRGTPDAILALKRGNRVILGLRQDQSTLSAHGQGPYNDRFVVLWQQATERRVEIFLTANTQPTAQYDGNQRKNKAIIFRRADGLDVTGDNIPELGRLSEGTYELLRTTHHNPTSAGTNFSLRPTPAAVASGQNRIERDSNHDGFFDERDGANGLRRFSDLNDTFKIHSGSKANTDSSGCQTIAPADYSRFATAVIGSAQNRYQYTLTRVQP